MLREMTMDEMMEVNGGAWPIAEQNGFPGARKDEGLDKEVVNLCKTFIKGFLTGFGTGIGN